MEIVYNLNEYDILALAECRMKYTPKFRKRVLQRRYAYLVGFVLMALGSFSLNMGVLLCVIFVLLAILTFLGYPSFLAWQLRRRVHNECQDEKIRDRLSDRTIRITDDGLEDGTSVASGQMQWVAIDWIYQTDDHTFLSVQENISIVIPKHGVCVGNYEEFVEILKKYIPAVPNNALASNKISDGEIG